jgi:hypothetical protein
LTLTPTNWILHSYLAQNDTGFWRPEAPNALQGACTQVKIIGFKRFVMLNIDAHTDHAMPALNLRRFIRHSLKFVLESRLPTDKFRQRDSETNGW